MTTKKHDDDAAETSQPAAGDRDLAAEIDELRAELRQRGGRRPAAGIEGEGEFVYGLAGGGLYRSTHGGLTSINGRAVVSVVHDPEPEE